MRRRDALIALAALRLVRASAAASRMHKASFRSRRSSSIVPRAAGGVVDVVARFWAEQVKSPLGNVVIENQGGGGGIIAAQAVARAKPDGYTLLAGTTTELVISPVIATVRLRPAEGSCADRDHGRLGLGAHGARVAAGEDAQGTRHLRARPIPASCPTAPPASARRRICAPNCSSSSPDCPTSCTCPTRARIPALPISTPAICRCLPPAFRRRCSTCIDAGKIRILVAGSDRHLAGAPEIPTNVEAGFPDLVTLMFMGLFAPGGTPRPIIDQIAGATRQVMADKDFQTKAHQGRLRAGDRFRTRADREIRSGRTGALDADS